MIEDIIFKIFVIVMLSINFLLMLDMARTIDTIKRRMKVLWRDLKETLQANMANTNDTEGEEEQI